MMQQRLSESDDNRRRKRTRVSQACDQCRRRKDRCDGQQPKCLSCARSNRKCTYNPSKKRGLPTGYVKVLETLMGLILHAVPDSESIIRPAIQECLKEPVLSLKDGHIGPGGLLDIWRKSEIFKQLEEVLSLVQSSDEDDAAIPTLDDKLMFAVTALKSDNFESQQNCGPLQTEQGQCVPQHNTETINECSGNESRWWLLGKDFRLDASHLPSNWLGLVQRYIVETHSWFPISQKHEILRIAYTFAGSSLRSSEKVGSGEKAFLWAIFTLTAHRNQAAANFGIPSDEREDHKELFDTIERTACNQVEDSLHGYDDGHVRALLVLTVLRIAQGDWSSAWILIGKALYLASDLGIVHCPVDDGINMMLVDQLNDDHRRVALGCFLLDTLVSTRIQRRSHLIPSDLRRIGSIREDGIEEWEPWKPQDFSDPQILPGKMLSAFNTFVEYVGIINELSQVTNLDITEDISKAFHERASTLESRVLPWIDHVSHPPQTRNLGFVMVVTRSILLSKSAFMNHDTHGHSLENLRSALEALSQQCHPDGFFWCSPLLDLYITLIDKQLSAVPFLFDETSKVQWNHLRKRSLSDFQTIWQRKSRNAAEVNDEVFISDSREHQSSQTAQEGAYLRPPTISPSSYHSDATHMALTPATSIMPSISAMTDIDDDILFNNLTMLDSVDCPLETSRFLEHLGLSATDQLNDFSTIF